MALELELGRLAVALSDMLTRLCGTWELTLLQAVRRRLDGLEVAGYTCCIVAVHGNGGVAGATIEHGGDNNGTGTIRRVKSLQYVVILQLNSSRNR